MTELMRLRRTTEHEFAFAPHFSRQVSARFSERQLGTEEGALLSRENERRIGLLSRVRKCFSDYRHPASLSNSFGTPPRADLPSV
jgi:hypothetical protein